eukprot:TRINITY_DN2207_c2_g1_i1.p1 TRINITY_DN2207_c2_g1~~TRINITY_DN2207_c2_g1_i1.p1  ORF type:complete len:511 (-),score=126.90 TRINITY_DN2207_c2_g1_i1:159-1472(-)
MNREADVAYSGRLFYIGVLVQAFFTFFRERSLPLRNAKQQKEKEQQTTDSAIATIANETTALIPTIPTTTITDTPATTSTSTATATATEEQPLSDESIAIARMYDCLRVFYEKYWGVTFPAHEQGANIKLVEQSIKKLSLTYLRRVALFLHVCLGYPSPLLSNNSKKQEKEKGMKDDDDDDEFDEAEYMAMFGGGSATATTAATTATWEEEWKVLHSYLALPSFSTLLSSQAVFGLVAGWCTSLRWPVPRIEIEEDEQDDQEEVGEEPEDRLVHRIAPPVPFDFHRSTMPALYENLEVLNRGGAKLKCPKCGTKPKHPALCLLCGDLLCFNSGCCRVRGKGECNQHARRCGAGEGVFLLANDTVILILRYGVEGRLWNSPYLDSHGEEDQGLRRGRPLALNRQRYNQLRSMWLEHDIANQICKRGQASGLMVHWHRM